MRYFPLFRIAGRTVALVAATVLVPAPIAAENHDANADLETVVSAGDLEGTRVLLDAGADPNMRLDGGRTPLMYAAANAHPEVARLLLSRGARCGDRNDENLTALLLTTCVGTMMPDGEPAVIPDDVIVVMGPDDPADFPARRERVVRLLLANGAYVNVFSSGGMTPLMCAAGQGHLPVIEPLLNAGAQLETYSRGDVEWTPLMFAAQAGHQRTAEILLRRGADVNRSDPEGLTPLILAASAGQLDTARLLLEHGAEINAAHYEFEITPLIAAAIAGHEEMVRLLLMNGAGTEARASHGKTALEVALELGHVRVAELLRQGPPPREVSPTRETAVQDSGRRASGTGPDWALLEAAGRTDVETVKRLLAEGANVDARDHDGVTPLMRAIATDFVAEDRYLDALRALLAAGADVNARDRAGNSPLMHASRGATDSAMLMKDGTLVVTGPPGGHAVLETMYVEAVRALLARGANVDLENSLGQTALSLAAAADYAEISSALVKAGARDDGASRASVEQAESHYRRGREYLDAGNLDGAIVEFTELLRLVPMSDDAYALRGSAYLEKGEYERAIADSTRAIELNPLDPVPLVNRGAARANLGAYETAIADLEKAIGLDPSMAGAYGSLGTVYLRAGDHERALEAYERALASGLSDPSVLNNAAWLYATATDPALRDPGKAIEYATRAVETTRSLQPGYLDTLAEAYFASGDIGKAVETIRKAIDLDPDDRQYEEQLDRFMRASADAKRQP